MKIVTLPTRPPTLAEVVKRAERLIALGNEQITQIVGSLRADEDRVAVLFDGSDTEGMAIHHELGFVADPTVTAIVMDLKTEPLFEALRRYKYRPLDEQGWEPGTVLLYVFTQRAVVVRRFAEGKAKLVEVRRAREVEFVAPPGLSGSDATDFLIQTCAPIVKTLHPPADPVAVIEEVPHGARVSLIGREHVVSTLRSPTSNTPGELRDAFGKVAEGLTRGGAKTKLDCVLVGWASGQLLRLDTDAHPGDDELAIACRDQDRALGVFKKRRQKIGESPVSPLLADLLSVLRSEWTHYDSILAKVALVEAAGKEHRPEDTGLFEALAALTRATSDRKAGTPPSRAATARSLRVTYAVEAGTLSGPLFTRRVRRSPDLPLTVDDVKLRLGQMIEALPKAIPEAAREIDDSGAGETTAVVLFDGSDSRGMEVYRKLGPTWELVPEGAITTVVCRFDRLDRELSACGYTDVKNRWGDHQPGTVRIVALTLGIVIVHSALVVEMVKPGMA
jgi:hypothetical protein